MPKDTYEEHQKRMRAKLKPPAPMGRLGRGLRGLKRRFSRIK